MDVVTKACIAFNQVLLNQPEDKRDQPTAMRAAIAALFDWMEEPSEVAVEAGVDAPPSARNIWRAMLAEMRKEALGATPPTPPQ